ncbi:MAG: hypothetical protein AAF665_13300 [Pseudomonadota bacterium]
MEQVVKMLLRLLMRRGLSLLTKASKGANRGHASADIGKQELARARNSAKMMRRISRF